MDQIGVMDRMVLSLPHPVCQETGVEVCMEERTEKVYTGADPESLPAAAPVNRSKRIDSIDVIRGVAILGILVINIITFGLPSIANDVPTMAGGMTGVNGLVWWISHLFFSVKWMPVFSMLFGAGLVMMYERFEKSGLNFRRFWYRRMGWMILFGLIHGYLLWKGDILFLYAVTGLLLYFFRKIRARNLLIAGVIIYLAGLPSLVGTAYYFEYMESEAERIEEKAGNGEEITKREDRLREAWDGISESIAPDEEKLSEIVDTYRGGYTGIVRLRAPELLTAHTISLVFHLIWRVGGLMLLGMGLMKYSVFSASRSLRFYLVMAVCGYGAGLPVVAAGARVMQSHQFDYIMMLKHDMLFNYIGGIFVSMGHIAAVMIFCKGGVLGWLRASLAAVGRMALSNYLSQTIICTTFFFGYGLGMFARLDRAQLMIVVILIWILQISVSPIWLKRFRFGPAEWLWRSLTYGKMQPMKIDNR